VLRQRAPSVAVSAAEIVIDLACAAIVAGLAMVVIVRQRRQPIGWLLLVMTTLASVEGGCDAIGLVGLHVPGDRFGWAGGFAAVAESSQRPQFVLPFAILLLFPTGRPPSARWRPLVYAVLILSVLWFLNHLLAPAPLEEDPFVGVRNPLGVSWPGNQIARYLFLPAAAAVGALCVVSVVVRFRRSEGVERQQLKWVGVAAAGVPLSVIALAVSSLFSKQAMSASGDVLWLFYALILPASVVVAVTRYRLWDLDLLLNRTAVYGAVSAVLVATYAAVVLLLSHVVVRAGWTSPWVVAIATLCAVSIAAPARRAIQGLADRTFRRRAWDAVRQVQAFAARWRDSPQPPAALQDLFRSALGDPSAQLGYWLRGHGSYIAIDGTALDPGRPGMGRSVLALAVHGDPLAIVVHDAALDRDRRLLDRVGASAVLVTENARLQAEVLERLDDVRASRARIVAAGDAERRKVERDLHDGAQQRLVGLAMRVRLESRTAASETERRLLEEIVDELRAATRELRELARGIHPAALDEGLWAALESLVSRLPLDVRIDVPAQRLPQHVELAAYYIAGEAITNAVKHADASAVDLRARIADSTLVVEVRDDGRGGADPARGSGLAGLRDRVDVLGGTLHIVSPLGLGTTITASLPCAC
jgi:signal transduction histidine kinase